jgi:hypothetical protein
LLRAGVAREDADEMVRVGVLQIIDKKGRPHIAREDSWLIDLWGEMRASGFTKALGFSPSDFTLFAESMEAMFARERDLLKTRLSNLPPEEVAAMVERAVPLLNQFMARYHESLVRKFFASLA